MKKYYGSFIIQFDHGRFTMLYPFSLWQWTIPHAKNLVIKALLSYQKVTPSIFVQTLLQTYRLIPAKLKKVDKQILIYLSDIKKPAERRSLHVISYNVLAHYLNVSKDTVIRRIKKMLHENALYHGFALNSSKLGFLTVYREDNTETYDEKELLPFILFQIHTPKKIVGVYQYPPYIPVPKASVMTEIPLLRLTFSWNLRSILYPEVQIDNNPLTFFSLDQDLYPQNVRILDLEVPYEPLPFTAKELEILKNIATRTPVFGKLQHVAKKFGVAESFLRKTLSKMIKEDIIYYYPYFTRLTQILRAFVVIKFSNNDLTGATRQQELKKFNLLVKSIDNEFEPATLWFYKSKEIDRFCRFLLTLPHADIYLGETMLIAFLYIPTSWTPWFLGQIYTQIPAQWDLEFIPITGRYFFKEFLKLDNWTFEIRENGLIRWFPPTTPQNK